MNTRTLLLGIIAATVGLAPAAGAQYQPLSDDHTRYGVSQYWVVDTTGTSRGADFRIDNPNRRTHVVAVLTYDRRNEHQSNGTEELFRGCEVRILTPHGSISGQLSVGPGGSGAHLELIGVPRNPARVNNTLQRQADGLGFVTFGTGQQHRSGNTARALHPALFSGADESVNPAGAVEDCVCNELAANNLPLNLFNTFLGNGACAP